MALVELHIREKIVYESFKSQKQLNEASLVSSKLIRRIELYSKVTHMN